MHASRIDQVQGPALASLRTLERHYDFAPALVQMSALEAAGIPCFLGNYDVIAMRWWYMIAIGGIRVDVLDTDLDAARALISAPVEPPADFEPCDVCARCGSTDIYRGFWFWWVILAFYYSVPFGVRGYRQCRDCKFDWYARRAPARVGDFTAAELEGETSANRAEICPNCGSWDVASWRLLLGNLISVLRSRPLPPESPNRECNNCGTLWNTR